MPELVRVIAQLEPGRVVYSGWGEIVEEEFSKQRFLLTSADVADWVIDVHGPFFWRVV